VWQLSPFGGGRGRTSPARRRVFCPLAILPLFRPPVRLGAPSPFPASPINFLFVTKIAIIPSFYSNFPHFSYKTKFRPAPYLLRTRSVPAPYLIASPPIDILLFSFHRRIVQHKELLLHIPLLF